MASLRKLLLLCGFVASTVAVPVSQNSHCARYCSDENDFTLQPGSTYTYDYETTAVTTVQGVSRDKTQLQMTAHADIQVLSKCEFALKLRGVQLKQSDPNSPDYLISLRGVRDFARSLEKHTLKFSFQNGKVEHVCPEENVPDWITNIQKGVLSAFQTHIVSPDLTIRTLETDILGKCTAEYHSLGRSWQGMHTIRKVKDFSSCTERENIETFLQGTPYATDFQTRSLPVIKGHQECEQVLGNGFLQSSSCNEKLIFRPFSSGGNGVITTVTQKLTYADTTKRVFTGNDYRPTQQLLLYTHPKIEENSGRINEETEKALKELCDASKDEITLSVPRKFSAFVYKLKKLPLSSLKTFYQKSAQICPDNSKARKFFMDAIPLVNTIDSANFIYEMISKKLVSESESKVWLTSLTFITDATPEMITTFTPLLNGKYDQALLGVSSFIHNFCKDKDCSRVPQVRGAIEKLSENLGENCFSGDEKTVILTLKAIGNIGHLFGKERILKACYKNPQLRTETRLAAIEAFRRTTCELDREDLLKMFSNYNEDTEIRIAAYLAVMKCPSPVVIDMVKNVMMQEKINHVGSFIWTHLNALAKTKHPERQEIRQIVSNLYLMNKYASDARKFSTAHEATYYLESLDSGIHVDSHLIFSTDSYLPRSAMFNLTVDVFGKTSNLFQIDGRLEGLEHVVEQFFGPSGYFPQKHVAKILREKRSLSQNKLNEIEAKYNENARPAQQPYGSLDVKVFGTSMWYNQYKHDADGTTELKLLDIVTSLAEQQEKEYTRSFMFLDTTFTIPMTSGLPLKIAVNGTASVALKIGGKFDVKSFEQIDILGHIEPSGAIEIASLLTVDAGNVARSGMRVVSTMHSSSILDGKVEVKKGEVVKVQLNMPKDKIEIFNVESKLFLVHGAEEREKKNDRTEATRFESCTGRNFNKVLGVKFCSELELPPYRANTPLHPLNGPARINIYIEKTDPTLKSYNFDALWRTETKNNYNQKYGVLSFSTPESRIDRDIKMEFNLNQEENALTFKLKTPVKRLGVNAKLVNEESQKKLDFSVTVDDKEYFSLQSDMRRSVDKNSVTYAPFFEVRIPSRKLVSLTGNMQLKYGQKYTAQVQLEHLTQRPILAKANIELGKRDRYDIEVSLSSFALDGTIKGYTQFGDTMSTRLTADYRMLESKMNKISVVCKMRNLSANALIKYSGQLNIQASVLPEWNTELQFETMRTTGHIENMLTVSVGDGARSRIHTIKVEKILRYQGDIKNNKIDGSFKISYPEKRINYGLTLKHENTLNTLKNSLQIQYDARKTINTEINLKKNGDGPLSLMSELKLKYPGREAAVQVELSESNPQEYRGTVFCQWQEGKQVGVVVHYKNKSYGDRFKREITGNLNLPNWPQITFTSTLGFEQSQFSGFVEANMGGEKYRMKTDLYLESGLNYRLAGQTLLKNDIYSVDASLADVKGKISGNVNIKMPNRYRISAKLEGKIGNSAKFCSIETYWDADRDTSKRFIFNGEFNNQNDGYEGKINMQVMRRSIKGHVSTSLHGNLFSSQWKTNNVFALEWSSRDKISAALSTSVYLDRSRQQVNNHMEVTTPFYGYENLTVSLTHLYTNQQWDSELATKLPYGNDITLSSTGKYSYGRGSANVESSAKIQTSYPAYEEMYVTISHDHNMREIRSNAELKWGLNKIIQLSFNGAKQASMMRASASLMSPFRNFQELSGEVTHSYSKDNYRTKCDIQWAPSKKMSVVFVGNHELSGRRRICTVNIECSTPFRGYENTAMKITYGNDGTTVTTDTETSWNRNKITSSVSLFLRSKSYNKNMEGKVQISTPFRNYENIQLTSSLEMNANSFKFNAETQLPHRSTASFNSQGKMININDIELNAVIIGQIPKVMDSKRVSLDFVHKLQNSKLRSTLDASYGSDRVTVLLIGLSEAGYNSRNIEFSATVNTPLRNFEELKTEFSHNQRGPEYFTKFQVSKNQFSGSLSHKLVFRDLLNFDSTLETVSTMSSLNGKISVAQESNGRQIEHNSFILWDKNKKLQLNAQYIDKSFLKEILIKVATPFRKFRELELKSSYEKQDWEHKAVISALWDRRNKMSLSGDLKNFRWESMYAQLEFLSPFEDHEFYSAIVKYDLTAPKKQAEISLLWDVAERKSIAFNGNFLHSSSLASVDMTLTTPFRNFEKTVFSVEYNFKTPEETLMVFYERGWRKIVYKGKTHIRRNSAEFSAEFTSPYEPIKDISGSAKFLSLRNGMKSEMALKLDRYNKYESVVEYERHDTSVKASLSLKTPIRGYEHVNAKVAGLYKENKLTSEFSYRWSNKLISFESVLNFTPKEGDLTVNIKTPFTGYRDMKLTSMYKIQRSQSEGKIEASLDGKQLYSGRIQTKYGGEHLYEVLLDMDSQYSPLKNVQLILSVDSNPDLYQFLSTLKWEDKESDIQILLNKRLGQFYEAKLKVNTPFEGFRLLSFDSSLRNDRNKFMDGRLILVTPFEYLRNLDIYSEYKNDDSGHYALFKIDIPVTMKLEGKLSNTRLNPLTTYLEIEASFMSFKNIRSSVEINSNNWNNIQATFTMTSPNFNHKCVLNFVHENAELNLNVEVTSSSLRSKEATLSITTDYKDLSKITTELSSKIFGRVHSLAGHYKASKNSGEVLIEAESHLLPHGKFQIKAWLNRRRNDRNIEGTISFTMPNSYHSTSMNYENKGDHMTASFKIDSDIMKMNSQAKYINNNGRDIEAALTVTAFNTDHTFVASLKNYEDQKYIQIKVDCPMATYFNPLTITGTLKHQDSTDGSLSIVSLNKEVRIAGNLKQSGWKNIEAFLTVNTPFKTLNMLRMDGRFQCDRYNENIDFAFQLESSNRNLRSLGITAKQSMARGSEEVSVMLRLPVRKFENVQLLGSLHYNPDYSSADSRITLSVPENKFSIYGQYGIGKPRISGRGEIEINNAKWSASGRLDQTDSKKDVSLTITSPASDSYTVGGAYGSSRNQRQLALTYSSPRNQRYNLNTSITLESRNNFEVEFQVQTPFYHYRSIEGRVNHIFNSHNMLSNVEYTVNDRRGFLKVHHRFQRDGVKGSVQISCPHHASFKDTKLSYSRVKKYTNIEDTLEMDYNRAKQFKMEVILFGAKSSHFVLDVKPLDLTISADKKQTNNGQEIVFKSSCSSRVVSFQTSYENDNRQFLHNAAFSWDEKAEKRIYYDFRLANTDTGKDLWCRFDTPIRSFMLKGNFTKTNLIRSGGINFYWDASRSLEKHMAIGVTQTEVNSNRQHTQKLQINLEHPKLSKDIVLTNMVSFKPSEFYMKNELEYSRDRNDNLLIEIKGNDMSRGNRETHYKGEFLLKHPASRLDVRMLGEMLHSKVECSANLMLNTLDSKQSRNIREIKANIMKLRQEIDIMMRSNEQKMSVAGKVTGNNGEYDISLVRKTNEEQDLTAKIRFSRRNRALDVVAVNSGNTGFALSTEFPKESISLTISHLSDGNSVIDADMFVGLEQSKILKSRLNWRPRLMRDLRIATGETIRAFSRSNKERFTAFSSTLKEEWSAKIASISKSMSEVASPLLDDLRNSVLEIENDVRIANNAFWRMYSRNEFYLQDIVESYNDFKVYAKEVIEGLSLACDVLYNIAMEQLEDLYYSCYYSLLDFSDYMNEVIVMMNKALYKAWQQVKYCMTKCTMAAARRVMELCDIAVENLRVMSRKIVLRFDKWLRSYAPCIIDGYFYMKHAADKIRDTWTSFSTEVTNYVTNNRVLIALKNYGKSIWNTIIAFRDYEYAESAQAFIDRYYDLQLMDTIVNHPTVEYMSGVANSALRKSVEVYHNLGLDIAVSAAIENAKNYVRTKAISYAQDFLTDFYRSQAGAKYIFTPERGYVSFEVTLPSPKNSLMEVFDYKTYPEYHKIANLKSMAAEYYEDFCFWDHYYSFTKYFTLNYWLPPFRAHALVSGNQHFISFDKLSYDFAGKCSYLLARDFVDGNFTAVVNYGTEDHMRRSLTILADGKKIDIGNDYKITLDDVKAESPIQVGDTIVMREGPNVRVDNEKKGFSIVCNFVHNYCSISISGFYYGKTAGLLGTYNHEPKLDWMTPGRHLVDDVETFASTWEVGQGVCQSTENYATLPTSDYRVQNKCRALFEKSTSEFRACFKRVNPETYLRMCITDLAAVIESDHNDAICESAAAYFIECKSEGIPLKMPRHCVKCEKQDGTFMTEGQAIQYPRDGDIIAADVVFLIEEKPCNKDRVKYLSKMAQGIEDSFRQKGYRDVRYSVVGFGGDRIHAEPHVHTMDGLESGPLRSIESALNSLEFGHGPVNILEAIRFAASLNFRTGTTKSFILVKCSTCKSEELRAEYSEMLRTLLDGDITLHLLMDHRYEMKNPNKNSKARRVIGVDKKFAYTLKDVKDTRLSGDGDLLNQLKIPKDVCIPLALEVNGSTFDSQFLMETKKNTNKKFMDVFSRLVVRSSADSNIDWGMCCECLATEDGVGKSTCQRCVSAEMASMISPDTMVRSSRTRVRKHKEARKH